MGEAALSCENKQNEEDMEREHKGGENSSVKWERFLPRMSMRVLLIEADDSTRQIIAALLRKCNYKVACVSDGLKAWEILKARAVNIDLILTEMDLPSISGYALLTLMTEHDICRNIPVIMMSSHDSISTVYKCMLKGASDYLVKPLRINEMRNLWQHVWRRQSSTIDGNGLQNGRVAQQKEEGTAENNGASNHSSDRACARRNKDAIEKGSDAQSSCTKPDLEADNARVETTRDFLQPQMGNFLPNEAEMHKQEMLTTGESKVNNATSPVTDARSGYNKMDANIATETSNNNDALINSFKEAGGSNGALYGHNCREGGSSNGAAEKYDSSPLLGLSLRRCDPSGSVNQATNEKMTLKLSESSAFSRYVNKPMQLFNPPSSSASDQHKEYDSGKNATCIFESESLHHSLDAQKVLLTLATGQSEQPDVPSLRPEQRAFPVPLPVRVTQFDNVSNSYGSVLPPVFHAQSGLSQSLSAGAAGHQQNFHMTATYQSDIGNSSSEWLHGQIKHTEEHKFNSLEGRVHISSVTDQSASSTFYNDTGYGSISGSTSNPGQIMGLRAASEIQIDGGSHRSSEREAALTKFRQKRKDRCFEKKVRYESRKKLAEQRPRVKGQFVRQVDLDSSPVDSKS